MVTLIAAFVAYGLLTDDPDTVQIPGIGEVPKAPLDGPGIGHSDRVIAQDERAMREVLRGQIAIEKFAEQNGGSYERLGYYRLRAIDHTVFDDDGVASGTDDSYRFGIPSVTGNFFLIRRHDDGEIIRLCSERGEGACPEDGNWTVDTTDK